ncbi:unnamed protein product [Ostreobium quekettii]|uniref:PPM-type phosphatase domain-containing protein n=1 Tax=Ostreobium quekettii TaxID=121088 RepID=A0A8S1J4G2_9CHLO|nr:unnamed protein product [Ostreobium quekettii]
MADGNEPTGPSGALPIGEKRVRAAMLDHIRELFPEGNEIAAAGLERGDLLGILRTRDTHKMPLGGITDDMRCQFVLECLLELGFVQIGDRLFPQGIHMDEPLADQAEAPAPAVARHAVHPLAMTGRAGTTTTSGTNGGLGAQPTPAQAADAPSSVKSVESDELRPEQKNDENGFSKGGEPADRVGGGDSHTSAQQEPPALQEGEAPVESPVTECDEGDDQVDVGVAEGEDIETAAGQDEEAHNAADDARGAASENEDEPCGASEMEEDTIVENNVQESCRPEKRPIAESEEVDTSGRPEKRQKTEGEDANASTQDTITEVPAVPPLHGEGTPYGDELSLNFTDSSRLVTPVTTPTDTRMEDAETADDLRESEVTEEELPGPLQRAKVLVEVNEEEGGVGVKIEVGDVDIEEGAGEKGGVDTDEVPKVIGIGETGPLGLSVAVVEVGVRKIECKETVKEMPEEPVELPEVRRPVGIGAPVSAKERARKASRIIYRDHGKNGFKVQIDGEERGTYIWRDKDAIIPDPCEMEDEDYQKGLTLAQGFLDTVHTNRLNDFPCRVRAEALKALSKADLKPVLNAMQFFMGLCKAKAKELQVPDEEVRLDPVYSLGCKRVKGIVDGKRKEMLMKVPKERRRDAVLGLGAIPYQAICTGSSLWLDELLRELAPEEMLQFPMKYPARKPEGEDKGQGAKGSQAGNGEKRNLNGKEEKERLSRFGGVGRDRGARISDHPLRFQDELRRRPLMERRPLLPSRPRAMDPAMRPVRGRPRSRSAERGYYNEPVGRSPGPMRRLRTPSPPRRRMSPMSRFEDLQHNPMWGDRSPDGWRADMRHEDMLPAGNRVLPRRGAELDRIPLRMGNAAAVLPSQLQLQTMQQGLPMGATAQIANTMQPTNQIAGLVTNGQVGLLGVNLGGTTGIAPMARDQLQLGGQAPNQLQNVNIVGGVVGLSNQQQLQLQQLQQQQQQQQLRQQQLQVQMAGMPAANGLILQQPGIAAMAGGLTGVQPMQPAQPVKLVIGGCRVPDPARESEQDPRMKLNEDSFSICNFTFAVADGLGGTMALDVSSARYSEEIVNRSAQAMEELVMRARKDGRSFPSPTTAIEWAHSQVTVQGATTICLLALDSMQSTLHVAKVGDGGYVVLRPSLPPLHPGGPPDMTIESPWLPFKDPNEHPRGVNSTHYLTSPALHPKIGGVHPRTAIESRVMVAAGDAIIAGTDGFFDAIYLHGERGYNTRRLILERMTQGWTPQQLAEQLVLMARGVAQEGSPACPFAEAARGQGDARHGSGARPDDVAVVVAYVAANSNPIPVGFGG